VLPDQAEFHDILQQHVLRYPQIQVQDLLKLAYQNEFAGGHLVLSSRDSLKRLAAEVESLPAGSSGSLTSSSSADRLPLFEDIGNGLCRMNLTALSEYGIRLPSANRFFIVSSSAVQGDVLRFQAKLLQVRQFLAECRPACLPEMDHFLQHYNFESCPPFSHSETYRQTYHPAYRVVLTAFRDALAIFLQLDELMLSREHVVMAVDGMCAAGKSTLAALIKKVYRCPVIPTDHFFLPASLRTPQRLGEPGGNIDYERFAEEVLPALKENRGFDYRVFNCGTMSFGKTVHIRPSRLHLVEGTYSLHPRFSGLYDLTVMLEISPEEQKMRIRQRNSPQMAVRFLTEWIPLENQYFKDTQTAKRCDLVVQLL
jgi:uridine kinase